MEGMNENHKWLCGSAEWAAQLQETVLPRLFADVAVGDRMLEIGPGPGAATDWLRHRVGALAGIGGGPSPPRKSTPMRRRRCGPGSAGPTWRSSPATRPGCRGRTTRSTP